MPKKLRRPKARAQELAPDMLAYLQTGDDPPEDIIFACDWGASVWAEVGAEITAGWIRQHPGSRPWGWWRWTAPRALPGDFTGRAACLGEPLLKLLCRPRLRLSGVGSPLWEQLNYMPELRYGLPTRWAVPPNPSDPPRYESQAAYLVRLDLLTASETRRLPADAYEPELVIT